MPNKCFYNLYGTHGNRIIKQLYNSKMRLLVLNV